MLTNKTAFLLGKHVWLILDFFLVLTRIPNWIRIMMCPNPNSKHWWVASIIPSKNNAGGILILRNSVFNWILRNFSEFRHLIPAELKISVKFPPKFCWTEFRSTILISAYYYLSTLLLFNYVSNCHFLN